MQLTQKVSVGKLIVIVNDFKSALNEYGYKQEARKLDLLIKNPNKFNFVKLETGLLNIGYDVDAPIIDRPSLAYEALSSNTNSVIDLINNSYQEIKDKNKIVLTEGQKEFVTFMTWVVAITIFLYGFFGYINWNYTIGQTDGIVLRSSAKSYYGGRDVDTTSNGILSLMVEKSKDERESRKSSTDIYKVDREILYIQTPTATKGKLKATNDPTLIKPYEILEFETNNDLTPNAIIELTTHVASVEWLN